MKSCRIAGFGTYLPETKVVYGNQTRHRIPADIAHLDMLEAAARQSLDAAGLGPSQVDCVIFASAAGVQPIPCTAALVQERLDPKSSAACFDVNSTCTSFITGLDVASLYIDSGHYERILIVSGDVGSRFLNHDHRESLELFSDAAAAFVIERDPSGQAGVIASLQRTWPEYAHDTELKGGLSLKPAQEYADSDPADYLFSMQGRTALVNMLKVLPEFCDAFYEKAGLGVTDFDCVIPHQASKALTLAMRRLGIPRSRYIDKVESLGNMVAASVPYVLAESIREGRVAAGSTVLLCGTAAGLTANALALRV